MQPSCWMCQLDVALACVNEVENCSDAISDYDSCAEACDCGDDADCELACVGKCDAEHVRMLACYKEECPQTDCL